MRGDEPEYYEQAAPMAQAYPQQQQTVSQPVSQDELYANMMQEERVRNVLSQVNPDNMLNDIKMTMRGYTKNFATGSWEKIDPNQPEPHPLLVGRFMSFLASLVNQSTTLSNLQEIQINKLMMLVIDWVADDLEAHQIEYDMIGQYTEMTRIGHIILNAVFMTLNRALNGGEARRMWGTLTLQDNLTDAVGQKRGFMDSLKFWKQ